MRRAESDCSAGIHHCRGYHDPSRFLGSPSSRHVGIFCLAPTSPWWFRRSARRIFRCVRCAQIAERSHCYRAGSNRAHRTRKFSCNVRFQCTNETKASIECTLAVSANLTAEVMLIKCFANDSCVYWRPMTAAAALWPRCSMNMECAAVTNTELFLPLYPESKGTLNTKLSGSIECWSTARLNHDVSIALAFKSAKCLQKQNWVVRCGKSQSTLLTAPMIPASDLCGLSTSISQSVLRWMKFWHRTSDSLACEGTKRKALESFGLTCWKFQWVLNS